MVEVLGEHRIDQSAQREHHAGEENRGDDGEHMHQRQPREEQRYDGHHGSHEHAAQDSAAHVSRYDQPIGQGRDQQFLQMLAEFGAEKRRHDIAVGIGDHGHHDESGRDELHVIVAAHLPHPPADQTAEDDEVQGCGDGRGHDGLPPDAHDAAELPKDDGLETDPLGPGARCGHGHDPETATVLTSPAAARPAAALPSTRRMNSSSRRLTLLRMLLTAIPCADSCANMSLRLWLFDISISKVCGSDSTAVNPDNDGAASRDSRKLNTNTSVCSLRNTLAMLSRSMMLPPSMIATLRHRFSASSR